MAASGEGVLKNNFFFCLVGFGGLKASLFPCRFRPFGFYSSLLQIQIDVDQLVDCEQVERSKKIRFTHMDAELQSHTGHKVRKWVMYPIHTRVLSSTLHGSGILFVDLFLVPRLTWFSSLHL